MSTSAASVFFTSANKGVPKSIPASVTAFLAKPHSLFIGGAWCAAASEETIDLVNPSTGKVLANAAVGGPAEIDAAVQAARRAFDAGPWSRMMPPERRRLLLALADEIEANIDDLALIDSLNMGGPLDESRFINGYLSAENLRYYAGWVGKISGETLTTSHPGHHGYTLKEPIGVVGAIVPWNSPLMAAVVKLAPALAAGCTVVLKPAEITPLSVVKLGELIQKVGFPEGVINIVNGYGAVAGQALVEHPDVDKIAFTGSTAVGQMIVRSVAATLKRVTLELGGKSPVFIFPDADLDKAIDSAAAHIFRNAGQICAAGSRIYVHHSIYNRVLDGLSAIARNLRVGDPLQPGVEMGPIVSKKQFERVTGYVESGRREGADLVTGGKQIGTQGFFLEPTILTKTQADMRVVKEEIFGPVLSVMPFGDDLNEVVRLANDTTYGLSAYLWTNNIGTSNQLVRSIRAGSVRVNGGIALDRNVPFGGYKRSGWGREYGRDGIEAYFETKAVTVGC